MTDFQRALTPQEIIFVREAIAKAKRELREYWRRTAPTREQMTRPINTPSVEEIRNR